MPEIFVARGPDIMKRRVVVLISVGMALITLAVGFIAGRYLPGWPGAPPVEVAKARAPVSASLDLSLGYHLLAWALENEARLEKLLLVKAVTFDRPAERVIGVMRQVSDAADNTLGEVSDHRLLEPQIVPLENAGQFGDVLRLALQQRTKGELLDRSPDFAKRMLVSQFQALDLVSVLAEELAKIDPNKKRQAWLGRVAGDYQQMHDAYLKMLVLSDPE